MPTNLLPTYNVAATSVKIPYNRYAQLETGRSRWRGTSTSTAAFVLQGDKSAVKNWLVPLGANPDKDPARAQNRRLRPRPLVIRANAGECVKVNFTNELDPEGHDGLPSNPRASMRVTGVPYDAKTSDGSMVGFNPDTTVGIGESIRYFAGEQGGRALLIPRRGHDRNLRGKFGSISHGLYGAFAVEPAGSSGGTRRRASRSTMEPQSTTGSPRQAATPT